MARELEFKIDGWQPATIPQDRLGAYLIEVAKLYGEPGSVHFGKVRRGSVILVSIVDDHAIPKVQRRLMDIERGQAPKEATDTYRRIDDMLADDNSIGVVRGTGSDKGVVVSFPGRNRAKPIEYAAIREEGFLEGEIIRIGGKDKTIHLALQSGDMIHSAIETDRDTARRLGALIFGPTVRLDGTGSWRRSGDGTWSLDRFVVSGFLVIGERTLADSIQDIRSIRGSEWGLEPNPVETLLERRTGVGSSKR